MTVTVIGQRPGGPVLRRTVTLIEFIEAFGKFAPFLWQEARDKTVVIDGHRMRLVLGGSH